MKALIFQLDGKLPNLACMRIAAHERARGADVELRRTGNPRRTLFDENPERVYGSLIFERSRPKGLQLQREFPGAIIGGTGWSTDSTLEEFGVTTIDQDYSIYPEYRFSIGFTQRGCRLKCPFCVVPRKEGAVREEKSMAQIWRGEPFPRKCNLLDNDFFGQERWRERIAEIRDGGYQVSFSQGINARFLTEETAEAIASIPYRDDDFKVRRIYTAWDNRKDEARLFAGLDLLAKHGVDPDDIMVYMLIGYWPGETVDDWLYRQSRLRQFGCRPYPMPFDRSNRMSVRFQTWVVRRLDVAGVSWHDFWAVGGRQEKMRKA